MAFGGVDFRAIRVRVGDLIRSLGGQVDDPSQLVGLDAGRMHLVAIGANLAPLFAAPQTPTRMEQVVSPASIGNLSVVTITPVRFDVQFDYLCVLSTLARVFLYVEPVDQVDPIEAGRTVVAPVHRRLMFDGGTAIPTAPGFEVAVGNKGAGTYPNTTGFLTGTGPFEVPVEGLATGPHVPHTHVCPRLPVGYRLAAVGDQTVNQAIALAFIARELTGVPIALA